MRREGFQCAGGRARGRLGKRKKGKGSEGEIDILGNAASRARQSLKQGRMGTGIKTPNLVNVEACQCSSFANTT